MTMRKEEQPIVERLRERISGEIAEGRGFWRSCSGCHESNEGYPTGEYSDIFQCHLGSGCSECGGIGAVWDDTDYADMADFMMNEDGRATTAESEASALRKALEQSVELIDHLMHVHVAPDECSSFVRASRKWFAENGGTLACIAEQQARARTLTEGGNNANQG